MGARRARHRSVRGRPDVTTSDPAVAVAIRAAQARADLSRIEKLLADTAVAGPAHQAVRDRFQMLVRNAAEDLNRVVELAERNGAAPGLWSRMTSCHAQVAIISREALAFVQGALLRGSGLDDGVGAVADHMLTGLTGRTGVERAVLIAVEDREFFDHTVSMVRLRFPDTSVWGLPILAHELGHHVASALADVDPQARGTQPILRYLSSAAAEESRAGGDAKQVRLWMHELFADVYATYALGAAYPLAMLMLRASPDQFADATATHPSWRRRFLTIVGALDALAATAADPAGSMAMRLMAREAVVPVWRMLGGEDPSPDEAGGRARRQAGEMVDLLIRHAPTRLRYRTSGPVERLAAVLGTVAADPLSHTSDAPDLPPGSEVAHVLNAAWRWRVRNRSAAPADVERVSRAALALCRLAEA